MSKLRNLGNWIKNNVARVVCIGLVLIMLFTIILTSVVHAAGVGQSSLLGSNLALGSPLLNDSFSSEDWNKWETVAFGVFLSNFTKPLIDSYESAFTATGYGSDGGGYKALCFGSGNDPSTNQVLVSMLNRAIDIAKKSSLKPIYVSYTTEIKASYFTNLQISTTATVPVLGVTDADRGRVAKFRDLLLVSDAKNATASVLVNDQSVAFVNEDLAYGSSQYSATLPVMYIVSPNNTAEVVLNYADSWDMQTALASIVFGSDPDIGENDSIKNFETLFTANPDIQLDCYGNIVADVSGNKLVVIPASTNQHLTTTPQINLLNSIVMDNYTGASLSATSLTNELFSMSSCYRDPFTSTNFSKVPPNTVIIYQDSDNSKKTKPGERVSELLNTDLSVGGMKNLPLNIKVLASSERISDWSNLIGVLTSDVKQVYDNSCKNMNAISSVVATGGTAKVLTELITDTGKMSIFNKGVVTPTMASPSTVKNDTKLYDGAIAREYAKFLGRVYDGEAVQYAGGTLIKSDIDTMLQGSGDRPEHVARDLISNGTIRKPYAAFIANGGASLVVPKKGGMSAINSAQVPSLDFYGGDLEKSKKVKWAAMDTKDDESLMFRRITKVYGTSDIMKIASNILGARDGTNFASYCPFIYLTYLDWYGVSNRDKESSLFNTNIFDDSSEALKTDIDSLLKSSLGSVDKKKDIVDYTYLLLHPTLGRDYRNQMIMTGFSGWVYSTYSSIVYGNATSYYSSTSSTSAQRNSAGFLNLDSYADNFMTSWLMKDYSTYVIYIMGIVIILLVVFGIIRNKKASWYLFSIILTVNCLVITPTIGELLPYFANQTVQSMFQGNMSYWAISESVTNSNIEASLSKQTASITSTGKNLTQEDQASILGLIKKFNILYLDRSLSLKLDISKKITQTSTANLAEVQKMQSTRWLLPTLMRQFTASDSSANYVYVTLGDMYDNMSNLYWRFNEADALTSNTILGSKVAVGSARTIATVSEKIGSYYEDYKETSKSAKLQSGAYDDILSKGAQYIEKGGWQSISREKGDEEVVHTYSYLLSDDIGQRIKLPALDLTAKDYWDKLLKDAKSNPTLTNNINQFTLQLEKEAGEYNYEDLATVKDSYGYLWATESPMSYMYQVIKDTFETDANIATIAYELQGEFLASSQANLGEVQTSFMRYADTGKIKDFLDFEELFTNVTPYLYGMTVITGGTDGTNGVLGDEKIENYDIYTGNYKSWLYRSNWAIKLMENNLYTKPATVKDSNGKVYEVSNPMLPSTYNSNRPMCFSEAEMYARGLKDTDLNLVELKIQKVAKQVEKEWTLMLNYINIKGMTRETMYRHMSLLAVTEFNREFSSGSGLNSSKTMFPTNIDLRSISFDSVMKMMMLNSTKDTSYIYGDTMKNTIENSDIFSALLLLVNAFLCAYIVPLVRNVLMGLMFYLGFAAMIRSIISSNKAKLSITCGFLLSNIIFFVLTSVYYGMFSLLAGSSTQDGVLNSSTIQVSVGNPVWAFILILLGSMGYIVAMLAMMNFCFNNYVDMGMEVYKSVATIVANNASKAMDNIKGGVSGAVGTETTGSNGKSASKKKHTGGNGNGGNGNGNGGNGNDTSGSKQSGDDDGETLASSNKNSGYNTEGSTEDKATGNINIDGSIKKGRKAVANSEQPKAESKQSKAESKQPKKANNNENDERGE